jgi:hypothetical protein
VKGISVCVVWREKMRMSESVCVCFCVCVLRVGEREGGMNGWMGREYTNDREFTNESAKEKSTSSDNVIVALVAVTFNK